MVNTEQIFFTEAYKHYTESNLKQRPKEKKKQKTVGYITPAINHYSRNWQMGVTDPSSDMSCYQKQKTLHNFDSWLCQQQVATLYKVACIDQNRNIPGLKQLSILEQKNPSMKFHLGNPQICSRMETSLKIN